MSSVFICVHLWLNLDREQRMAKVIVATVDEIPPGGRKVVEVRGRTIGVFNLEGEFFALRDRCPHQGGPLCQGHQSGLMESDRPGSYRYSRPGEILRCPWHGWEFDIRTGRSRIDPERLKAPAFAVAVAAGADLAEQISSAEPEQLQAETFPVTVEEHYVVVEA